MNYVPIVDEPSISVNRAGKKPLPAIRRSSTTFGKSISRLAGTRLDFKSSTSPEGDLAILGSRCGGTESFGCSCLAQLQHIATESLTPMSLPDRRLDKRRLVKFV